MKLKHFFLSLVAIVLLASCEKDAAVTGIAIDKSTSALTAVGQKDTLTATIAPSDASATITWASSNTAVATVVGNGKTAVITAVGAGTAKIVASADIFTAECTVTVTTGGGGSTGDGAGTKEKPYSVAEVITLNPQSTTEALKTGVWIKGFIVGYYNSTPNPAIVEAVAPFTDDVNIMIAATAGETDKAKMVSVQLPSGVVRTALGLKTNAANLAKSVLLFGDIMKYNNFAGLKNTVGYWFVDANTGVNPPVLPSYTTKFLDETLLTQASFDKFTGVSVDGVELWKFDSRYGAVMSGFANSASHKNEDWFVSPKIDLTGQTNVKMSFDHARGPAASIAVGIQEGWYKVYATSNYTDVATSTWVEVTGVTHGTVGWGFVTSGVLAVPISAISANTRIAFKYVSSDAASATWEVKNLVVGK